MACSTNACEGHCSGNLRSSKMCFVVQNHLGKGTRCAPPLHPPGRGSFRALSPFQSHQTVSPVNHSRGRLRSPCTLRSGGYRAALNPLAGPGELPLHPAPHHAQASCPLDRQSRERSCCPRYPHDHFMETRKGAFALPLPWSHPIDQRAFKPLGTLTSPARIGCTPAFRG